MKNCCCLALLKKMQKKSWICSFFWICTLFWAETDPPSKFSENPFSSSSVEVKIQAPLCVDKMLKVRINL